MSVQFYASGKSANELRDIALNMKANDVREIRLDEKKAFLTVKKLKIISMSKLMTCLRVAKNTMYVVATELKDGEKSRVQLWRYGAGCSCFGVDFRACLFQRLLKIQNMSMVALVSPVPVDVARELGADIIIAVDILARPIHTETSNVLGLV